MTTELVTFKAKAKCLFANGALSDFTVICGEQHYKAHRAILMCHSAYFETCFLSSNYVEAQQGQIILQEDPPEAVKIMMAYFYSFDYEVEVPEDADEADKMLLEMHSKVYAIAEKYQIPDLKELARFKFAQALVLGDGSIFYAVDHVFASTHEDDFGLRDVCLLSYALSAHTEKTSGNADNVTGLISTFKKSFAMLPAMLSAELATYGLVSQAGLLKKSEGKTGSEMQMEDLFVYLSKHKSGTTRVKGLRLLVDLLGSEGW